MQNLTSLLHICGYLKTTPQVSLPVLLLEMLKYSSTKAVTYFICHLGLCPLSIQTAQNTHTHTLKPHHVTLFPYVLLKCHSVLQPLVPTHPPPAVKTPICHRPLVFLCAGQAAVCIRVCEEWYMWFHSDWLRALSQCFSNDPNVQLFMFNYILKVNERTSWFPRPSLVI